MVPAIYKFSVRPVFRFDIDRTLPTPTQSTTKPLHAPLRIAAVACASHTRYRAIPAIVGYMTQGKQRPCRRFLTPLRATRLEDEFRHHNLPNIAFCVFTEPRFRCIAAPGYDRVNRGRRAPRFRRRFKRLCKTPHQRTRPVQQLPRSHIRNPRPQLIA